MCSVCSPVCMIQIPPRRGKTREAPTAATEPSPVSFLVPHGQKGRGKENGFCGLPLKRLGNVFIVVRANNICQCALSSAKITHRGSFFIYPPPPPRAGEERRKERQLRSGKKHFIILLLCAGGESMPNKRLRNRRTLSSISRKKKKEQKTYK